MKFFTTEDFHRYWMGKVSTCSSEQAAEAANAKLEREGKVVEVQLGFVGQVYNSNLFSSETKVKALLINIEPLETCKHPKEKIGVRSLFKIGVADFKDGNYECECGAKVKPKEFEEIT